jgi:membrane-bound lytic murein transglycosylase D
VFKRNFEAHSAGKFASWTAWSAPSTMSAAEAARRVGMSEADLRQVNSIPPRMLIKAGSVLIVPRTGNRQEDVASHVADNGQLSLAPEVVLRRTTVRAGKHDSVASIARRYKVSAAQVADWNDVGPSAAFRAGQQVVLHLPVRARSRGPVRAVAKGRPAAKAIKSTASKRGAPVLKSKRR